MGTWGTGIFDDDTAADIRDDYLELVASASNDEAAREQLWSQFMADSPQLRKDLEPLFWLTLALTQWENGRLDEITKSKAIEVIDSGAELERWKELDASQDDIGERAKVLADLRKTLNSPQKRRKNLKPRKKRGSQFQAGDIVQFTLSTGRLVLFRITSLAQSTGGEAPVAEVLDWVGTSIPSIDELTKIPGRQKTQAGGLGSVRFPRILLADFPGMVFDHGRLKVIGRVTVPPVASEGFTIYPLPFLEKALAKDFGLE